MNNFNFLSGHLKQWKCYKKNNLEIWFSGYNSEKNLDSIISLLYKSSNVDSSICKKIVSYLGEHFGIVVISKNWIYAAVDYTRGYPLYWNLEKNRLLLSPQAHLIMKKQKTDIDNKQLIAFRMSGYTINQGTIWKNIHNLSPGSFIFFNKQGKIIIKKYFLYLPTIYKQKKYSEIQNNLKSQFKNIIKKIILNANGKTIIIPLSAGLDSRFIASGLKHYNYSKVRCFSYGHKNNHEAAASEKIANRLGFKWKFVEISHRNIKKFYSSDIYKEYIKLSVDGCATSTIQGLYAIDFLLKSQFIKKNNILINGNSGDFISGGHIPKECLADKLDSNNYNKIFNNAFIFHYEKHYSLWSSLNNNSNKQVIRQELFKQVKDTVKENNITAYGVLEFLEYENRQTKYVVNSQRIYDYYELSWLLPLWNKSFIKFWEKIPLEYKLNQCLYRDTLKLMNYGSVWTDDYDFPFKVASKRMRFIRFFFKLFFLFIGKKNWYKFEKKYLSYWTENIYGFSSIKYLDVIRNKNGPRNYVSWYALIAEKHNTGTNWQEK